MMLSLQRRGGEKDYSPQAIRLLASRCGNFSVGVLLKCEPMTEAETLFSSLPTIFVRTVLPESKSHAA
jgi:hypothetical protein